MPAGAAERACRICRRNPRAAGSRSTLSLDRHDPLALCNNCTRGQFQGQPALMRAADFNEEVQQRGRPMSHIRRLQARRGARAPRSVARRGRRKWIAYVPARATRGPISSRFTSTMRCSRAAARRARWRSAVPPRRRTGEARRTLIDAGLAQPVVDRDRADGAGVRSDATRERDEAVPARRPEQVPTGSAAFPSSAAKRRATLKPVVVQSRTRSGAPASCPVDREVADGHARQFSCPPTSDIGKIRWRVPVVVEASNPAGPRRCLDRYRAPDEPTSKSRCPRLRTAAGMSPR